MTTDVQETAADGDALDLGPVQQTLLVPLWARAAETRSRLSILSDPRAVEIVDALGDRFGHFNRSALRSRIGIALRTLQFDDWLREFQSAHPGGTVADVGVGLNTRFERCDDGVSHWLEVDLPDSMAVRRRYFAETDRRFMMAGSVLESDWIDRLLELPPPYFVCIEGVLMYLPEGEVRRVIDMLGERLPGATLTFDALTPQGVADQSRHDTLKHFEARFDWGVEDVRSLEGWRAGLICEDAVTLKEIAVRNVSRMPWFLKLIGLGMSTFRRRAVKAYWLAKFQVG
ncbi:class I SAM-dependent methyltransferase [Alienimonas sp. DA493]|uniref:class I SAM-dependent methyltransferase n=1 Tax=Alienimonas sp. DA493 TaxID=3373605 RepID=UPI003754ED98